MTREAWAERELVAPDALSAERCPSALGEAASRIHSAPCRLQPEVNRETTRGVLFG